MHRGKNEMIEAEEHLAEIRQLHTNKGRFPTRIYDKKQPDKDSKVIHFIRHGRGTHNDQAELKGGCDCRKGGVSCAYKDIALLDARLTEEGIRQAEELKLLCKDLNEELIVVSPLSRALTTATVAFSSSKAKIIAHESLREQHGVHVCDKRRSVTELRADFPRVDFSLLESEEDLLFHVSNRETRVAMVERGIQLLEWIRTRPEKNIVVVGHSSWLLTLFNAVLTCEDQRSALWFSTGELRTVVIKFQPERSFKKNAAVYGGISFMLLAIGAVIVAGTVYIQSRRRKSI